jgi:hypothetical protein
MSIRRLFLVYPSNKLVDFGACYHWIVHTEWMQWYILDDDEMLCGMMMRCGDDDDDDPNM